MSRDDVLEALRDGRAADALALLTPADLASGDPQPVYLQALALAMLGSTTEAIDAAKRCLQLELGFEPALELLDRLASDDVPVEEDQIAPGSVLLDTYEVQRTLGQGGMGRVHLVRHRGWGIELAMKTPLAKMIAAAGGLEAFEEEALRWVALGLHPNVVSLYYTRRIFGQPRLFAEYASGGSLEDAITELHRGGSESERLVKGLGMAAQLANGLAHVHGQGLVHGDVKPANAMRAADGTVKVTDFGVGYTPAYCSPEQVAGRRWTLATDVWSFGLTLLQIAIGQRSWVSGSAAAEILAAAVAGRLGGSSLPGMLAELLARCFDRDPERRPQMAEVWGLLDTLVRELTGRGLHRPPDSTEFTPDDENNRAVTLLDLGREDEGLARLSVLAERDHGYAPAAYNLALLRWRRGEIDDLQALASVPPSAETYRASLVAERGVPTHPPSWSIDDLPRVNGHFALSPDETLFTYSSGGVIHVVRTRDGVRTCSLMTAGQTHTFARGGQELVVACRDGTVELWDLATAARRSVLSPSQLGHSIGPRPNLAVDDDASMIAISREDHSVHVWTRDAELPVSLPTRTLDPPLAFWRGKLMVGDGSAVRLWDVTSCEQAMSLQCPAEVAALLAETEQSVLYAADFEGTLTCFELPSGRIRWSRSRRERWNQITLQARQRSVLVHHGESAVQELAASDGRCVRTLPFDGSRDVYGCRAARHSQRVFLVRPERIEAIDVAPTPPAAPYWIVQPRSSEEVLDAASRVEQLVRDARNALHAGDNPAAAARLEAARLMDLPERYGTFEVAGLKRELARRLERRAVNALFRTRTIELPSRHPSVALGAPDGFLVLDVCGAVYHVDLAGTVTVHTEPLALGAAGACAISPDRTVRALVGPSGHLAIARGSKLHAVRFLLHASRAGRVGETELLPTNWPLPPETPMPLCDVAFTSNDRVVVLTSDLRILHVDVASLELRSMTDPPEDTLSLSGPTAIRRVLLERAKTWRMSRDPRTGRLALPRTLSVDVIDSDGTLVHTIPHGRRPTRMAFLDGGRTIVLADAELVVYPVDGAPSSRSVAAEILAVATDTEKLVAVGYDDGTVELLDGIELVDSVRDSGLGPVAALAFSPENDAILTMHSSGVAAFVHVDWSFDG